MPDAVEQSPDEPRSDPENATIATPQQYVPPLAHDDHGGGTRPRPGASKLRFLAAIV